MIQQFHFQVCTQKNWKQGLKEIFAHPCLYNIIHNILKEKATQMFVDGWMDKQNMV